MKCGGSDGTRTRDLRLDRPEGPSVEALMNGLAQASEAVLGPGLGPRGARLGPLSLALRLLQQARRVENPRSLIEAACTLLEPLLEQAEANAASE